MLWFYILLRDESDHEQSHLSLQVNQVEQVYPVPSHPNGVAYKRTRQKTPGCALLGSLSFLVKQSR